MIVDRHPGLLKELWILEVHALSSKVRISEGRWLFVLYMLSLMYQKNTSRSFLCKRQRVLMTLLHCLVQVFSLYPLWRSIASTILNIMDICYAWEQ